MKKTILVALGLCGVFAFTSCHKGEDSPAVNTVVVDNVVYETSRTIEVRITNNIAANIAINGTALAQTGTTATFEGNNVPKTGKIVVTPTDKNRLAKEIEYKYNNNEDYLVFDVVIDAATATVSQNEAESGAKEVNNDGINAEETGVKASIDFNGQSNTNAAATGDYSITVYTPAGDAAVDNLKQNDVVEEPVIGLICRPDGATFEQPITVKLVVPDSEGCDVACYYDGDVKGEEATLVQSGNNISIQVPHFSIWDVLLKVKVASVSTTSEPLKQITTDAADGEIRYTVPSGFSSNDIDHALFGKFLRKTFGAEKRDINKRITFKKVQNATAKLTGSQAVHHYTLQSGERTFSVDVYGRASVNLSMEVAEENKNDVPTHGGGSSTPTN